MIFNNALGSLELLNLLKNKKQDRIKNIFNIDKILKKVTPEFRYAPMFHQIGGGVSVDKKLSFTDPKQTFTTYA
jgi:hypothetical protein